MTIAESTDLLVAGAVNAAFVALEDLVSSDSDRRDVAWLGLAASFLPGGIPRGPRKSIPSATDDILEAARSAVSKFIGQAQISPVDLSLGFESHLAATESGALSGRRNSGSYYTPSDLIELVVGTSLGPLVGAASTPEEILSLRILDPAVGTGGFLVAAGACLSRRLVDVSNGRIDIESARRLVAQSCLFGADVNPIALALTAATLQIFSGAGRELWRNLKWADSILPPGTTSPTEGCPPALDLSSDFPQLTSPAFDAVIGNPPWGAVKSAVREFASYSIPSMLDGRSQELRSHLADPRQPSSAEWTKHTTEVRTYAAALAKSGFYRHQGGGDADLYRYFVERSHGLIKPQGGRLGLVIPGGFLRADGASPLRELLLETGTIESLIEFMNTDRVFDIHPMFRFVLLSWKGGRRDGIKSVSFGVRKVQAACETRGTPPVRMSRNFIQRVSGSRRTVPDVRSRREAALLEKLHSAHPPLEEPVAAWNVRFSRELDMTNDSRYFIHTDDRRSGSTDLALYEGRMVNQFDGRAKRYLRGSGRRAVWEPQGFGNRSIYPQYFVPREIALDAGAGLARAGFCDVSGHANERTVLATLIPAEAVAGNKVPTVRFDKDSPDLHLVWIAIANSFVIDWIARRRVATSLNYFQMAQLPFPRIEPDSLLGQDLANLTEEVIAAQSRLSEVRLRERGVKRAALDATIASLFDLELDEFATILGDFPLLDRHQPVQIRTSTSTITRDTVLLARAKHSGTKGISISELGLPLDAGPTDLSERVDLASRSGQIPYVPGELAKSLWR